MSDDKQKALEAIQQLQQRQAPEGNLANLAAAYVAAWGEIDNVVKNANNPHFKSNYADLAACLDTVRPIFSKHGLAIMQTPGEIVGENLTMMGLLIHTSGERITFKMQCPVGKPTAQAIGSALTYMRRYMLAAVGGIAQVDDDGNAASNRADKRGLTVDTGYQVKSGDLLTAIASCTAVGKKGSTNPSELAFHRPAVEQLGDSTVSSAYVAKKTALTPIAG